MRTSTPKRRASEEGTLLLPVLVLTLILAGLSVTMLHEALAERQAIHHHETSLLALEIAESGLVLAEMEILALADPDGDGIGTVSGTYGGGRYEVTAVQDGDQPERWTVRARGEHGLSVRLIEVGLRRRDEGFWLEGLFSDEGLKLTGTMATDSYDSRAGTWLDQADNVDKGGRHAGGRGHVGSNEDITLNGSSLVIRGNAIPGPLDVVSKSGQPTVWGDTMPRRFVIPLPAVTYQEFRSAMLRNDNEQLASGSGGYQWVPRRRGRWGWGRWVPVPTPYDEGTMSVSAQSDTQVVLDGGTYFFTDLKLSGQAQLVVRGPSRIYITGDIDLTGGGVVNATGVPGNLQIFAHPHPLPPGHSPSGTALKINGGAEAAAAIYAPELEVTIGGNSHLFGAIVGKTIKVHGTSSFHYDVALADVDGGSQVVIERLYWREPVVPTR